MKFFPKLLLLFVVFTFPTETYSEEPSDDADVFSQIISLPKPVHFSDMDGKDLLVPSGAYWVTPGTDALELLRIENGETYSVRATTHEHSETLTEPVALSIPGTDQQPDIHSVVYMSIDGSQLTAEGSYSGIQARGLLSDAVKAKAAAARKEAQRRAMLVKQKARQGAAEALRRANQAAIAARRKARIEMAKILQDIAKTDAQEGRSKAVSKAVRYAPRLAVVSTAALTPRQKIQLIQAARRELNSHMPFIKAAFQRAKKIRPLLRDGREKISDIDLQKIHDAIWGDGLQHPFAGGAVRSRGLGSGIHPSWSFGASADIAAVAGLNIGGSRSFPFNPIRSPGSCVYASVGISGGAQADASGSVDIGFYLGSYDSLGATLGTSALSTENILGGLEVAVNLGVEATVGADVTLLFNWPTEELAYIPLTGIQIGLAGGAGGKASVGASFALRMPGLLCG